MTPELLTAIVLIIGKLSEKFHSRFLGVFLAVSVQTVALAYLCLSCEVFGKAKDLSVYF
jgi:hypothetical protein